MDRIVSERARALVAAAIAEGVTSAELRRHARETAEALMATGERRLTREIAASMAAAELVAEVEGREARVLGRVG